MPILAPPLNPSPSPSRIYPTWAVLKCRARASPSSGGGGWSREARPGGGFTQHLEQLRAARFPHPAARSQVYAGRVNLLASGHPPPLGEGLQFVARLQLNRTQAASIKRVSLRG